MEPSVEEGFSFLDLEDCDVEARNYLQTIIEQRGPSQTTSLTDPLVLRPSDRGGLAGATNSRVDSKNAPLTQLPETTGSVPYQPTEFKPSEEDEVQADGSNLDGGVASSNSRISAPGKGSNGATNYVAPANTAISSRGSVLPRQGGLHLPGNFPGPQPVKVKPIQQTPVSSAVSTYIADAPQITSNPMSGNSVAGCPGGNVPPPLHAPSAQAIQQQHHQQAYAAAAAAAANVQHQHASNQTTPYVFINQVTANVNVHHGPVPNGGQQNPSGSKDTGSNGGLATGASQHAHMQPSQGIPVLSTHPAMPGPPSLHGTQPAGIHPSIHMPSGQMGPTTGMVPQSMGQPPPHHANVVTSLAATGIAPHPSGTALMHPIMPNPFQLPHQMAPGQLPYNTIPSRSGTAPSQQPHAPLNPATMMSMQQLQHMYGYPIFISPNVNSPVPPYAASGALHGVPQQQMAQVHAAQAAMAQVQQAQVNVQQTATQRQAIPPPNLQSHAVMLRNPLSPPAMQQGMNSLNTPSGIAVSQSHQKIAAGFTTHQRTPIQPISSTTSSMGISQNASSQPSVPQHMVSSITPSVQLPPQPQSNHPSFFASQQTANSPSSLPAAVIAASAYPPNPLYMAQMPQHKTIHQEKPGVTAPQRFQSSNVVTSSVVSINDEPDLIGTSNPPYVDNVPNEVTSDHEKETEEIKQLANDDELLTQDDGTELAFGTVDLKSLVAQADVDAFESGNIVGSQHSEAIVENISKQMPSQPSYVEQGEPSKYPNETNVTPEEVLNQDIYSTTEKTEELTDITNDEKEVSGAGDEPSIPSRGTPDLPAKTKSWASLFKSDTNIAVPGAVHVPTNNNSVYLSEGKLTARIQPYKENVNGNLDSSGIPAQSDLNEMAFSGKDVEMGNYLKEYSLNHRAPSMKPRGLSNRSNWCFVNAILQALLACPPFYNLMKSLPKDLLIVSSSEQVNLSVKILRAVYYFFAEFSPLDNFPKLNHRQNKNKKNEDFPVGKILEPTTIYNVLLNLNSDTFKVIEGRQEDAEEFLTFLLNGLNDEMMALLKLVEQQERDKNSESDEAQGNDSLEKEEDDGTDDEWLEVGPRGTKSCVTRRVEKRGSGNCAKSPLAEMFQGQMRSCVQHSNGEPTATLQPFLTLQLDIQSDKIVNVADAISSNFAVETIDGYMCSKTNQEIEASRSMSLEELPPILVLHLKRFIYDGSSNGCQKLLKNIDFPVDLEINRDILSPNSKNKYPTKQRQYKLFAVVYHNGTEATKGHYVTDIYHTGLSTWLRCDDSILKTQTESMVLAHSANSVPYILFYRRGDTMVGGSLNEKSGNKPTSTSNVAKS